MGFPINVLSVTAIALKHAVLSFGHGINKWTDGRTATSLNAPTLVFEA